MMAPALLPRLAVLAVAATAACAPARGTGVPAPTHFCPGGPGCERGPRLPLRAGAAAVTLTPRGFERVKPQYLERRGDCPEGSPLDPSGVAACGALKPGAWREAFFDDCGRDALCPGAPGYPGPDADGSEGDGTLQTFWLAGFGNDRPAMGVHDDVWARALALEQGDVRVALVVVDAIGLFHDDVERIRARARKLAPELQLDYLLVASTHTHEAPDTEGLWGGWPGGAPRRGVDAAWFSTRVVEGSARAAVGAVSALEPVRVHAAQPRLGEATPMLIHDTRSPFVADDAVTALRFVAEDDGATVATLVVWGNHPETLADTNNLISSDFVAPLRDAVEARFGGTAVFANGALGGMMSSLGAEVVALDGSRPRARSFAKARAVGERIAGVATDALERASALTDADLAFAAEPLALPVDNEKLHLAFSVGLISRRVELDASRPPRGDNAPRLTTEVAKLQLGPVRFLAVPGELFPELAVGYDARWAFGRPQVRASNPNPPDLSRAPAGPYLLEQLGGAMPCVLGLANDHLGYLVPEYDYVLDAKRPYFDEAPGEHYEETNSIGPRAVPRLLEAYSALLAWEPP